MYFIIGTVFLQYTSSNQLLYGLLRPVHNLGYILSLWRLRRLPYHKNDIKIQKVNYYRGYGGCDGCLTILPYNSTYSFLKRNFLKMADFFKFCIFHCKNKIFFFNNLKTIEISQKFQRFWIQRAEAYRVKS